jgi:hypothetical protein
MLKYSGDQEGYIQTFSTFCASTYASAELLPLNYSRSLDSARKAPVRSISAWALPSNDSAVHDVALERLRDVNRGGRNALAVCFPQVVADRSFPCMRG